MTPDRHFGVDDHGSLVFPSDEDRQQGIVWRLAGDGDPLRTRYPDSRCDRRAKVVARAAGEPPPNLAAT